MQEMATTSDSNLINSLMNLFDCFLDDYNDEKYVASLVNLDIRAQLEVRWMVSEEFFSSVESFPFIPGCLLFLVCVVVRWTVDRRKSYEIFGIISRSAEQRLSRRSVRKVSHTRLSSRRESEEAVHFYHPKGWHRIRLSILERRQRKVEIMVGWNSVR